MSNLVDHAHRELALLGEDSDVIDGLCRVVQAFADMGHSGSSAHFATLYLEKLLRYEPLTELTDDPDEWIDRAAEGLATAPCWQSKRDPRAFSNDDGKTYWLVDERDAAGSMDVTPIHRTKASTADPSVGTSGPAQKAAPVNGAFPDPATGFRDYIVDAIVAWQRYDHEASDYDHDFDEAYAQANAKRLIDRAIHADISPQPEPEPDTATEDEGHPEPPPERTEEEILRDRLDTADTALRRIREALGSETSDA